MLTLRRFTVLVGLFTVWIPAVRATPPPTPVTNLTAPQGGKILYGTVDGATTQAAAMSKILGIVGKNCGEKPQIGRVFRFKGTKTVGVFFTVTNRPQGNKPVAGLLIGSVNLCAQDRPPQENPDPEQTRQRLMERRRVALGGGEHPALLVDASVRPATFRAED